MAPHVTKTLCVGWSRKGIPRRRHGIGLRHEPFVERTGENCVGCERLGSFQVHEQLKRCKSYRTGGIHHASTWRVPTATCDTCSLTVECAVGVTLLRDPIRRDHLREYAILQAVDQRLDFSSSDLAGDQRKRSDIPQRRTWRFEPFKRCVSITFEQHQGLGEDSR